MARALRLATMAATIPHRQSTFGFGCSTGAGPASGGLGLALLSACGMVTDRHCRAWVVIWMRALRWLNKPMVGPYRGKPSPALAAWRGMTVLCEHCRFGAGLSASRCLKEVWLYE